MASLQFHEMAVEVLPINLSSSVEVKCIHVMQFACVAYQII